eukprot:TRINITY_DN4866_c0_g1_i1.p1 TRINITY_DN4866_c0_g1~~TRINITY_DN4866_c0_g1_i1.p1  ORF type:complete len:867 (-),score=209.56 TRINITY_DN4866_c0_g1_i1:264-2864(-)
MVMNDNTAETMDSAASVRDQSNHKGGEDNIEKIEEYLLFGDLNSLTQLKPTTITQLCIHIFKGEYDSVIKSELCSPILSDYFTQVYSNPKLATQTLTDRINAFQHPQKEFICLTLGVALLYAFIQANWLGPDVKDITTNVSESPKLIINELGVDGETAYSKILHPDLFFASNIILVDNFSLLDELKSSSWWSSRTAFIHQRCLSGKSETLKSFIQKRMGFVGRFYVSNFDPEKETDTEDINNSDDKERDIATRFYLENGLIHHYYRSVKKSRASFQRAQLWTGLDAELTGVMGRRTRFQTFDTPQLVLKVTARNENTTTQNNNENSNTNNENSTNNENNTNNNDTTNNTNSENNNSNMTPKQVDNPDPTLLDKLKLKGEENSISTNLLPLDQAVILSLCLDVKNNNPIHGLTTEKMHPYVRKVLENANDWLVHTTALLFRSRLDTESSKSVERAALQVQALVDQFSLEDPPIEKRSPNFWVLNFPPLWELKKEMGDFFVALGAASTALQVFEALEVWESVIECYRIMDKPKKAEEIVRKQLEIAPTPELWCILGDLTQEDSHYVTAWEMSKHRYARAKRSLGRSAFNKKEHLVAIQHFEEALAINPLYPSTWFTLGCLIMQQGNMDKALQAFSRVVMLEPEEGEAWANISSIYINQGKLLEAFVALQEGLKIRHENWRMWQNFAFVCVDLKEFQQAIFACHRLLDIQEKADIPFQVLFILIKAVITSVPDKYGVDARKYEKSVLELMGRITSKVSTNPQIWKLYSNLHGGLGNKGQQLDCKMKEVRALEVSGWERSEDLFQKVAQGTTDLVKLYIDENTSKGLYSAKLKLKGLIKKTEVNFGSLPVFKELEALLKTVEEQEANMQK